MSSRHAPFPGRVARLTVSNSKNAGRQAQNRRAQQVYRRKREGRIKDLETQLAGLLDVRHHLSIAESKLKELALASLDLYVATCTDLTVFGNGAY